MSIINDALKKTQQNFNKQNDQDISSLYNQLHTKPKREETLKASSSPTSEKISTPQKSNPKKVASLFLIVAGIALLLSFIFLTVTGKSSKTKPLALVKSMVAKETAKMRKSVEKRPAPQKGELFLNGTMEMQGKTVALINDGIYEIGDTVEGKKIVDIRLDGVELLDGEQKIFLSAHQNSLLNHFSLNPFDHFNFSDLSR